MSRRTVTTVTAAAFALVTALGTVPAATAEDLPVSSATVPAAADTGSSDLLAGLPEALRNSLQFAAGSVLGSAIVGSYALCWAGEDPEHPTGHCTF